MKFSLKLFFVFILFLLISCSPNADSINSNDDDNLSTTIESDFYKNKDGVLTVCFMDYPPFEYVEDGKFKGPGYDIVVEAFKRAQINATFEFLPWSRILNSVKAGTKDVIVDVYMTEERKEFIDYSNTVYASYPEVLFVKKDSKLKFDGTAESLKNLKIGIHRDTYHGENFNKLVESNLFELEEVNDPKNNFEKLINNRIDAVIDTLTSGNTTIKNQNLENQIVPLFPVIDDHFSYVGFSKINNLIEIRDKYDEAIKSMEEDGTIDEIFKSYNLDNPRKVMID